MNHKLIQISLILFSLFSENFGQTIGLRLSPNSQSVNQPSNQQFVVTCKGLGAEPGLFSDIKWFDPRQEEINSYYSSRVNPDIRVEEISVGSVLLHFLNPLVDNSGNYSCSATFQHSDHLKTIILINFFQDVQWEDCPQIQSLILGSNNERIRCKAKSNPKPNISWSKDGKPLDSRYQIDSNGISINDVIQDSDGGVFRVRALVTETGRLHDTFISVQIFKRPQIIDFEPNFEGIEGKESTLYCSANGRPQPMISWLDPNKRNLSSVGGYNVDRNSGTLIISRVKKVENLGQFTCIAENDAGRDQKIINFIVMRSPIITSFNNQSFDQNSDSILECRATGEPRPLLTIRRDGDSRELKSGDPRVSLDLEEVLEETILRLRLSQSRRQDDGLYFCRAQNKGATVERVGHLEIRFAPDLSRTPLTSVKHWNLQPINITCIADAIPNATIRWFFRGIDLKSAQINNKYTIEENTLGMSRLLINSRESDIYGQYKCLAINSLGSNEIKIQLDQAFRPGSIIQITYDRITPTSLTFKIMAPSFDGGLSINSIHIQYRREDSKISSHKWPIDSTDTYFLDGLRPRTRYWLKFSAENIVGIGDWSIERMVQTERETRPEKPEFRNLPFDSLKQIVSPFSDQFMATWTLPNDNGRKIRYFEVKYYQVKKSEFGFDSEIGSEIKINSVSMSDQSMTSFTLKDLKPNTYYKIEIRANNELGFSDTESIVFKTNDAPSIVDHSSDLEYSSRPSLAIMAGLTVAVIIVLLILTDSIFFCRYKVGIIYFLTQNVFKKEENIPKSVSCVENRAFESQQPNDDQNEPFFGRASAV